MSRGPTHSGAESSDQVEKETFEVSAGKLNWGFLLLSLVYGNEVCNIICLKITHCCTNLYCMIDLGEIN